MSRALGQILDRQGHIPESHIHYKGRSPNRYSTLALDQHCHKHAIQSVFATDSVAGPLRHQHMSSTQPTSCASHALVSSAGRDLCQRCAGGGGRDLDQPI